MQVRERVRRLPSGTVKRRWECDLGVVGGKRRAIWFKTKGEAEARLKQEKEKLKRFGHAAYELTEADRHRFAQAQVRLAVVGASIEQAVDFYLSEHRPLKAAISLGALLDECVLAKELAGRRPRYTVQFAVSCGSFVRGREEDLVTTVSREQVAMWVRGNGWAPKTQRCYLGDLSALFSYAVAKEYLAKNPAAGKFELAAVEDREIEALKVSRVKRLLALAEKPPVGVLAGRKVFERPVLLWYLVLAVFCGIRPEELARLTREKVDLEDGHVTILAKIAKTRQRRVVDLPKNALAWLALDPLRTGPVIPKNFRHLWARLRFAAGFLVARNTRAKAPPDAAGHVPWPHDVLRHTFASMHYAHYQDEGALKAQMGHSDDEDTLMQHYRALMTRREAAEFWALEPQVSNTTGFIGSA